jgi:hypothetical protein
LAREAMADTLMRFTVTNPRTLNVMNSEQQQGLNKLGPFSRVRVMEELLNSIGANESHRLMPSLDLVTR